MAKKRIVILTGGGDCPGLNAVIRAAVRTARDHDFEVLGVQLGFEGLLTKAVVPLTTALGRGLTVTTALPAPAPPVQLASATAVTV